MHAWTYLVIHHSAAPDGTALDLPALRHQHMVVNGWADLGYHFVVERVGGDYASLVGRPMTQDGAHTKELHMNSQGLGICLVGNFDQAPPPPAQWAEALKLCRALMGQYGIPADRVLGHWEVGKAAGFDRSKKGSTGVPQFKSCPGWQFTMDQFRADLGG